MSQNDIDTDIRKRQLILKLKLFKQQYPEEEIPTFTIHTDLEHMEKVYDAAVRSVWPLRSGRGSL